MAGRAGPGAACRSGTRSQWSAERADELLRPSAPRAPEAVLAIGPLTNVAALLALGVELPALTVMGGALRPVEHRGRVQAVEHNFGADPTAAAVVVAMTDATIVPLDATVAMRLSDEQVRPHRPRAPRLVPEVARFRALSDDPIVLHDPLALLVALGEHVVRTASRRSWSARRGALLTSTRAEGREHTVVVAVDASAALDRVLGLLG